MDWEWIFLLSFAAAVSIYAFKYAPDRRDAVDGKAGAVAD
jgi:hypothetical protein